MSKCPLCDCKEFEIDENASIELRQIPFDDPTMVVHMGDRHVFFPIKYCPFCGDKIIEV